MTTLFYFIFVIGLIAYGIFQICLTFKLWEMCNNIQRLTDKFCPEENTNKQEMNEENTNEQEINEEIESDDTPINKMGSEKMSKFALYVLGGLLIIFVIILIFG